MRQADEWSWVIARKNGKVLACSSADHTTRHELRGYFPQYKGFPVRLVRGNVHIGGTLTPEQWSNQFRSVSEALSALAGGPR